jgi:hypothetical protein
MEHDTRSNVSPVGSSRLRVAMNYGILVMIVLLFLSRGSILTGESDKEAVRAKGFSSVVINEKRSARAFVIRKCDFMAAARFEFTANGPKGRARGYVCDYWPFHEKEVVVADE